MFTPFVPLLAQTESQVDSLVTVIWNFISALLQPFVEYGAANPAGCTVFALILIVSAMLIRGLNRHNRYDHWE